MRTKTLKLKRKVAKLKQQSFKHQLFALKQQVFISKYSKPILTALILLPLLAIALIQPKPVLGDTPSAADLVFHSNPASTIPECYGWSECFAFTIDTRLDSAGNTSSANTGFILPTNGMVGANYHSYDWLIDWGDEFSSAPSGISSSTSVGIGYSYLIPGEYRITIRPNVANNSLAPDGWLNAFGFDASNSSYSNTASNKQLLKSINSPFTDNMRKHSAATNQSYRFSHIFNGTSNMLGIPSGLFDSIDTSNGVDFANMFKNAFAASAQHSMGATIPTGLFDSLDTGNGVDFGGMFDGTFYRYAEKSSIATIPSGLFNSVDTSEGISFSHMFGSTFYQFARNSQVAAIPSGLFNSIDTSKGQTFNDMFSYAFSEYARSSQTATIPSGLFNSINTDSGTGFRRMFFRTFGFYASVSTVGTVPSDLFSKVTVTNGTDFDEMFDQTFNNYARRSVSFSAHGSIVDTLTQSFTSPYGAKAGSSGTSDDFPVVIASNGSSVVPAYNDTARTITKPLGSYMNYAWYTKDGTSCSVASPTPDCGVQNSSTLVHFPNTTEWTPTTSTEKGNIVFYGVPTTPTITSVSTSTGAGVTANYTVKSDGSWPNSIHGLYTINRSVSITGTNFTGATAVTVGGTDCTSFTVNSDTNLTCVIPNGTKSGNQVIRVTTPSGQTTSTATPGVNAITYVAAPTVTSVSNASAKTNGQLPDTLSGTTWTDIASAVNTIAGTNLNGSGFATTATVSIGSTCTSYVISSATTIICTQPNWGSVGNKAVQVVNAYGSSNSTINVNAVAAPTITSISPDTNLATDNGYISIFGNNFNSTFTTTVGGTNCTNKTYVMDMVTICVTPSKPAGSTQPVVTRTPYGTSNSFNVTYAFIVPVILSITPDQGPTSGGTEVTLTGTGFTNVDDVTFDGISCTNLNVLNDTTLTCDTPPHTAGSVDVIVNTTDSQTATLVNGFTYIAPTPPQPPTPPIDPEGPVIPGAPNSGVGNNNSLCSIMLVVLGVGAVTNKTVIQR